jgi:hypothetical protein
VTALPPDPDPVNTPGLEPGGGVSPGDTPPDSGSTTVGLTHHEHAGSDSMGPVTLAVILIGALLVGGLMLAIAIGWLR